MDERKPKFIKAGKEPNKELLNSCREMVVGPWVNQPDEYEGYNGFVGWAGMCKLKSGRLLMTFSSGYWHASPPLTPELLKNELIQKQFQEWHKIGMPNICAPQGGRAHIMHSDDNGKTWSAPKDLVNTKNDDRHPTIIELEDGTWVCTFFDYAFPHSAHSFYMRSTDSGETWSTPKKFPENPKGGFGNGCAFVLDSGRIICTVGKTEKNKDDLTIESVNLYASDDNGESFYLYSNIPDVEDNVGIVENSICKLNDGRYIFIGRRKGCIRWSYDECKSWSKPYVFGIDIFDPHFMLFPNGVLACFHGSYNGRGLRVLLSKDNGETWNGPKDDIGYSIDLSAYGYSHGIILDDGSAYIVYINTGGHRPYAARTQALFTLRVKPYDNGEGIEILSASGMYQETNTNQTNDNDPELGNLKEIN